MLLELFRAFPTLRTQHLVRRLKLTQLLFCDLSTDFVPGQLLRELSTIQLQLFPLVPCDLPIELISTTIKD